MNRLRFSQGSIPYAFLLLTLLSYGLLIPWLGFYWDDWPFAWISHFLGPAEFIKAFQPFRPFLGPIFFLTTSLLHESPLAWQIAALIVRFLLVFTAWRLFSILWANHKRQVLTISLLLLVFPGYSQHWVAFTHINQELIPLISYLASFFITAWGVKNNERYLPVTITALMLMFWGLFTTEYYIGLEPLRFLMLWFLVSRLSTEFHSRLILTLKLWLPYLILWILNGIWLFNYYRSGVYQSYKVAAFDFLRSFTLAEIGREIINTLATAGFNAWVQTFRLITLIPDSLSGALPIVLVLVSFPLIGIYLYKLNLNQTSEKHWGLQMIYVGIFAILLGRLPSWAANLPITLQSSYDRFMVSMMIGSCMLLAGLIEFLIRNEKIKILTISLVIALGIGQQFYNANVFRHDWERQKEILWQFYWRIPSMQPDTLILTHQLPLDYETDLSFTAPLNWIYAPNVIPHKLPYVLLYTEIRLRGPILPRLKPGIPVTVQYRTVSYHGSTSNALVIYVPSSGCLRVMDPIYANRKVYEKESKFLTYAIPLSNPSRILVDAIPPNLPRSLFGDEPAHTWCYYYEKTELARQKGDWSNVVALGEEALTGGYKPMDPFEWLPIIEGYARTDNVEAAVQISKNALQADPKFRKALCNLWGRILDSTDQAHVEEMATTIMADIGCFA
ncbi:MAG: hypothetical protein MUP03_05225 [Anaerolineales bacterium]|nr:hypothetical protein [Anaerolineales bacterium]